MDPCFSHPMGFPDFFAFQGPGVLHLVKPMVVRHFVFPSFSFPPHTFREFLVLCILGSSWVALVRRCVNWLVFLVSTAGWRRQSAAPFCFPFPCTLRRPFFGDDLLKCSVHQSGPCLKVHNTIVDVSQEIVTYIIYCTSYSSCFLISFDLPVMFL